MTLGLLFLVWGVFAIVTGAYFSRLSRVSFRSRPEVLSEDRRDEIVRYRQELLRYSPWVTKLGAVMACFGAIVVIVSVLS